MSDLKQLNIVSTYGKAGRLGLVSIPRKSAPSATISEGWLPIWKTDRALCWLIGNPDLEPVDISKKILMEIRAKRRGYREQDRKRKWNPEEVLTEYEIANKILLQKQKCWHCGMITHMLYRDRYDPLQWSVDRLDNDKGHTEDNVVISCMKCNLKRGNTSIRRYSVIKE
jgi:5-methylcytosine-specific restriction endonuclease McrA